MPHQNIHKKFFIQSIIGTFIITIAFFIDDFINDTVDNYLKNMKEKQQVQVKSFILLITIFGTNLFILYFLKYVLNFDMFDKCGYIYD
jgi:hypothetical protein